LQAFEELRGAMGPALDHRGVVHDVLAEAVFAAGAEGSALTAVEGKILLKVHHADASGVVECLLFVYWVAVQVPHAETARDDLDQPRLGLEHDLEQLIAIALAGPPHPRRPRVQPGMPRRGEALLVQERSDRVGLARLREVLVGRARSEPLALRAREQRPASA